MYDYRNQSAAIVRTRPNKPTTGSRTLKFARAYSPYLMCMAFSASAGAVQVAVPNADFSNVSNYGTIGGGLIGASGSGAIGSGPWNGTYAGVLGVLAPPTLTVSAGEGTISSIGVDLLGIANSGYLSQLLVANFVPFKHYVLAADVSAGTSVLGLGVLASGSMGLALIEGSSTVGSTATSSAISLTLQDSHTYHLAMGFDSTGSDTGAIGVRLFAAPTGVLAANLLSEVTFSNVKLTAAPTPSLPPNGIDPASGMLQAAMVNTAFSGPLVVNVVDAEGNPLEGIMVTFTAPGSGASAVLSSATVMTNVGGQATVTGVANGVLGRYMVVATINGLDGDAQFDLTNSAQGQPPIVGTGGGDEGQASTVGMPFGCMLSVRVVNGSQPAVGATVVFNAPPSPLASAILSDGVNSGSMLIETTDANGIAAVSATANATAGSYTVTATATALVGGALAPPVLLVSYPMTNLAAGDRMFADGFDTPPGLCGNF